MNTALTCPFCSLLCDDIDAELDQQGRLARLNTACPRAQAGFTAALADSVKPSVAGREVGPDEAVSAAARLLNEAQQPLIGGLDGDVTALQAALALGERLRASVDHRHGSTLVRQLAVLQRDGWVTTTLSEVRNRADLVVVLGDRLFAEVPRFGERILDGSSQFQRRPELVLLGQPATLPAALPVVLRVEVPPVQLTAALGAVRILLRGGPLPNRLAALPLAPLRELAQRLQRAEYPVVAWSSAEFGGAAAESLLAVLFELLDELSIERRAVALPLAADASVISALQVCTWSTGFPPPLRLRPQPDYDPHRYCSDRLLASNGVDAMLWLASVDPVAPPIGVPTVVLGHPALRIEPAPAVFIPVAVPGVDQAGQLFRSDGVALPLRMLRASERPAASTVLAAIYAELAGAAACN